MRKRNMIIFTALLAVLLPTLSHAQHGAKEESGLKEKNSGEVTKLGKNQSKIYQETDRNMPVEWIKKYSLTPKNPPNDGILFADLQAQGRSGHMGHALVEYAPDRILAFYPNCNGDGPDKGHSGDGWMEYKRSIDGGKTWSAPFVLPHSKAIIDSRNGRSSMCEKAIVTDDGKIIAFFLNCDIITGGESWEPYFEPTYAFSRDGGKNWSEPRQLFKERGRVYDARYRDGKAYVLFFANADLPGKARNIEHDMCLYVSTDNGESFFQRAVIPFTSTINSYYGTMEFSPDGRLIVYMYDSKDEHNLKYIVSDDKGETWHTPRRAFFKKKMRAPQLVYFEGGYFMTGRSGNWGKYGQFDGAGNFILYYSKDAVHWDKGTVLRRVTQGSGAYSNLLVVGDRFNSKKKRLLIQSSHAYKDDRTNTIMWWLDKR